MAGHTIFKNLYQILGAFEKLRKATVTFVLPVWTSISPSVPSAWKNSAPTRRIFIEVDIRVFFENLPRKFKFNENLARITGTGHGDRYTFMIISRSVPFRMRNVLDKSCREYQNTFHVQ